MHRRNVVSACLFAWACAAPESGPGPVWQRAFTAELYARAVDVATWYGPDGVALFVLGQWAGTLDPSEPPLTGREAEQLFLARLTADGELVWTRLVGHSLLGNDVAPTGRFVEEELRVVVAPEGYVYVASTYVDLVQLGERGFVSVNQVGHFGGSRDVVLAAFDLEGTYLWAEDTGGPAHDVVADVTTGRTGSLVVVGTFAGALELGFLGELPAAGGSDVVLAEFEPSGTIGLPRLVISLGWVADERAGGVAVDPGGGFLVSGTYERETVLGEVELPSLGGDDAFLARVDAIGKVVWARAWGGPGSDAGGQVRVATDGTLRWFVRVGRAGRLGARVFDAPADCVATVEPAGEVVASICVPRQAGSFPPRLALVGDAPVLFGDGLLARLDGGDTWTNLASPCDDGADGIGCSVLGARALGTRLLTAGWHLSEVPSPARQAGFVAAFDLGRPP